MDYPLLAEEGKVIRDPVLGYIHFPAPVLALVDTRAFQRLRNITQLGYVHLVYPGARHSRFEHSLGVYHLAKQFLARLLDSDPPLVLSDEDVRVFIAATLLHDIGHYPFSHTLEELRPFFIRHEEGARQIIEDQNGELYQTIADKFQIDPGARSQRHRLRKHRSRGSPRGPAASQYPQQHPRPRQNRLPPARFHVLRRALRRERQPRPPDRLDQVRP